MKKPSLIERLRAKKTSQANVVVGVAWYSQEQWARVKASAADPEKLEASYAEWVEMAEAALRDVRRRVRNVVKIYIDADELAAWCLLHEKQIDSSARAEFASHKMREHDDAA